MAEGDGDAGAQETIEKLQQRLEEVEKSRDKIKNALVNANTEAAEFRNRLESFESLGVELEELKEIVAGRGGEEHDSEVEKLTAQLEAAQKRQEKLEQAIHDRDRQSDQDFVRRELAAAGAEHDAYPRLLEPVARSMIEVERKNGKREITIRDENGTPMVRDDGEPFEVSDLVGWMSDQEQYFPLFKGEGVAGGGASGRSGGGAARRKPLKEMSDREKVEFIDKHGQEAYEELVMETYAG